MKRLFVVVTGTDGSGKSTVIRHIRETFYRRGVPSFYHHLRPSLFPDLGVLLGRRGPSEPSCTHDNPHALPPSGTAGSLLRWGYYLLDYTVGHLMKVTLPGLSGGLYIFDRYYYDCLIDPLRFRVSLPERILRLPLGFLPHPDVILCLGGDPGKIYARKPETSLMEVERQVTALREFCRTRKNAFWIDTTVEMEATLEAVDAALLLKR